MPSPFPGMDPYLEDPYFWPDVHHGVISQIQAALNPKLGSRYFAHVELRVYVETDDTSPHQFRIPDVRIDSIAKPPNGRAATASAVLEYPEPIVAAMPLEEIKESFVAIRELRSGSLVAIIEVLSPSNKEEGSAGRESFLRKRLEVLQSPVHWVEIDLLRMGTRTPDTGRFRASDYRVLVSRSGGERMAKFWPINVRQPLPKIGVPLKGKAVEVELDLGQVLNAGYDAACYGNRLDYARPPVPPLKQADARWANALLKSKGLR